MNEGERRRREREKEGREGLDQDQEGERGEGGSFVSDTVRSPFVPDDRASVVGVASQVLPPLPSSRAVADVASSSGFWRGFAFSHSGILLLIVHPPSLPSSRLPETEEQILIGSFQLLFRNAIMERNEYAEACTRIDRITSASVPANG